MTNKLCQNANFENGGTTLKIGILHVLLNIFSISLLSRVHGVSDYFEMQRVVMSFYILNKMNKMHVAG